MDGKRGAGPAGTLLRDPVAHAATSVSAATGQRRKAPRGDSRAPNLGVKLLRTRVRVIFALAGLPADVLPNGPVSC
jgi:hypothetical protein